MAAKREISVQILNFRVKLTNELPVSWTAILPFYLIPSYFVALSCEKINLTESCLLKGFVRDRLRKKNATGNLSLCRGVRIKYKLIL